MPDDARGSSGGGLSALVRLAIMLLLGGAVALPLVGQSGSRSGGTDSRAGASASSASSEKGRKEDAHTDALILLGEFVGLDVTDGALDERKARMAEAGAESASLAIAEWTERSLKFELTRRSSPQPGTAAPPAAAAGEPIDDYTNVDAREWQAFSREKLKFELVRRAFARRGIPAPTFLVATVPDPINSNANWTFDPVVSAIDRAAAASGFLMDRFYIPDWLPESGAAGDPARPRTTHEKWPGVVLFRSAKFSDANEPDKQLLVTSLVFETPTAGVHQEAFAEAVRIASLWDQTATLRVLGPIYSGSIGSLSNAIDAFPSRSFRVVTGSATSRSNVSIRRDAPPHIVSFKATVHPDDEVIARLVEYLRATAGGSERIALLVEGDTTYGKELAEEAFPAGTRILPFPLQISRLRSAAMAPGQPGSTASTVSRLLGLSLGQSGAPTDQLPSLTPGTTSASVELELAQVLDVITRDHITAVGLLATDTRDKLFLAQQLARRSAAVRLFTIESDLFYVHPDYNSYVRGMIVASTYPLFAQAQKWADGGLIHQQFPSTMAQGVYNAMVTLLNYDAGGGVVRTGRDPLDYRLLDYRVPGAALLQPPIWISVVGSDAIWPVTWYRSTDTDYVHPISGKVRSAERSVNVSAWTACGVAALGAIVALHLFLYRFRHQLYEWRIDTWPFVVFFASEGFERRQPYLFVAFTALCVAWGYVCALMTLTVFWLEPLTSGADALCTFLSVSGLACLLWQTVDLGGRIRSGALRRFKGRSLPAILWEPQYGLMLAALLSALGAAVLGSVYLVRVFWSTGNLVYYVGRAAHPSNGVSPATPMVLIAALVYLWAFAHLHRLSAVSGESIEASLLPFGALTDHAIDAPAMKLRAFIEAAVQTLPPVLTGAVLAMALISLGITFLRPLSSPEPLSFTVAFRAAWLLIQILLWLAFAHVAYFWAKLREAMHAFDGTPMIGAFARLSPHFFHDRLSPRRPDDGDVRRMAHTAAQLGLALSELHLVRFKALSEKLCAAARADGLDPARPDTLWVENPKWKSVVAVVPGVVNVVAECWKERSRPTALATIDIDADVKDPKDFKDGLQRWEMRAEEFLAMYVLLIVRELLSRLANVFFYVILAVMLLVAVQQSFPFQPRQELLGTTWVYVVSAVALILTIMVQMEHDAVLSAFASTASGTLNWDLALWSRILLYGVIPIATVFAAQFPGIGATLLEFLTPVQKALP